MHIVSFNTWKCDHHYSERLPLMASQLLELKPDVLLLEEVFRADGTFDTYQYLTNELQMQGTYLPARRKYRQLNKSYIDSESGLAILSRIEILEVGNIALPDDSCDGDRWAHWAVIEKDSFKLLIINTHLTHLVNRDDLRRLQIQTILDELANLPEYDAAVLGGDFNATLDNQSLIPLADAGWLNNWQSCASNCRSTLNIGAGGCIDHLFLSPASCFTWSSTKTALNKTHHKNLYPSDHMAVSATLSVNS